MVKKFNVVSSTTTTVVPNVVVTATARLFPSLALLPTLPAPPPLAASPSFSPTVVACSGHHSFLLYYQPLFSLPAPVVTPFLLYCQKTFPPSFVLPLLLCILVSEHVVNQDFKLSTVEFAYIHTLLGQVKAPMRLLMVLSLNNPQTLSHIVEHYRASESKFASHVH